MWVIPKVFKNFVDCNSSVVGSWEVSAAGSAAASVMLGDEVGKHAAAAFEDFGDFASVGAATAEHYNLESLCTMSRIRMAGWRTL